MKKIVFVLIIVVNALSIQAQTIYNDGARIVSEAGSNWVLEGGGFTFTSTGGASSSGFANITIGTGATLSASPSSNFNVSGTWLNNGTFTGATSGVLTLNGAALQTIGGSGTSAFGNLTLNNTAGFSLSNDVTVNGTLNFQNGILSTGSKTATLGASGNITNATAALAG